MNLKNDFPVLGEFLTSLAGAATAHLFVERGGKKELNPAVVRAEAPHFKKELADEARFAQIMTQLPEPLQKAILEIWIPSLGKNQQADLILSVAEMTVGASPQEKARNEQLAIQKLTQLARIPDNTRRTQYAVSLRFMKETEDGYLVVKAEMQARALGPKLKALRDQVGTSADNELANLAGARARLSALGKRLCR